MSTKTKTKRKKIVRSKKNFEQQKPTLGLAREGHQLSVLLWEKLMANLSPEQQATLLVFKDLDYYIWDQLAPNDLERVEHPELTNEDLWGLIRKAEFLLTGLKATAEIGLPDGYEI